MDPDVEAFLAHHGILGMQWGVRRVRRNEAVGRAAQDHSAVSTKLRRIGNLSRNPIIGAVDLVKGRGLKGASRRKFTRTINREARIKAGKGHVRDYIIHFGATRLTDFVPVRSKNANKVSTVNADRAQVAFRGALLVSNLLKKVGQQAV